MKTLYLIGLVVFVLVILFSIFYYSKIQTRYTKISEDQFVNPELLFGTFDKPFIYTTKEENPDFILSDGYYVYGPIENDFGIIVLHPISKDLPRYLGNFILLNDTTKNYILQIKVGNVAGKINMTSSTGCNDNIFEIYLSDIFSSGNTYFIDKIEVNSNQGWVYKEYSLNDFKGKNLYLQILSKAGGPCGNWSGEWGAISYLNIKRL